jgi:hypothetical protein
MNLADYLSELLGQYDEVSVPGLGYFVRERINGYYNDTDGKFYPPYHQVKFVPQIKDDDIFAQYVADKKNISLASSKYFAEKFVSKLREQAATGKYPFADLGSFQTDQDQQLIFKPYDRIVADPAFYGYAPVSIYKSGPPAYGANNSQAITEKQPIVTPQPIQIPGKQQDFEEETERKKPINIWLIILIGITILALVAFGIYKFYPTAFDRSGSSSSKKDDTAVPVYRHELKADTIKKAVPVKDTSINATMAATPAASQAATKPAADTVKRSRFEIIAGSFRQLATANAEVKHFKEKGVDAKILTDAPGPRLKISVGTFPTYKEAEAAMLALLKAGKIRKDSHTLEIKP